MSSGDKGEGSILERLIREFQFLGTEFGYEGRRCRHPETSDAHEGWYVVTFSNPAISRSLQMAVPVGMEKHLNVVLYCVGEPESVRIRDVEKYLPVKQLRAFYAPEQYESSDYIGQIVGFEKAVANFKAVLAESRSLLDGSAWIDRSEFDRKLFDSGKFRYASSAERFAFIDKARSAFGFLVEELGYGVTAASDLLPAYEDNNPMQGIDYGNSGKGSVVSVFYDSREGRFGIRIYRSEGDLQGNQDYELFNSVDMREQADYRFLESAANNLRRRLLATQ